MSSYYDLLTSQAGEEHDQLEEASLSQFSQIPQTPPHRLSGAHASHSSFRPFIPLNAPSQFGATQCLISPPSRSFSMVPPPLPIPSSLFSSSVSSSPSRPTPIPARHSHAPPTSSNTPQRQPCGAASPTHHTPPAIVVSQQPPPARTPSSTRPPNTEPSTSPNSSRKQKKRAAGKARRKKLAGSEPSGGSRDCWTTEQFAVLADSKRRLDDEMAAAKGTQQILSLNDRWRKIADWCKEGGVLKTPLQCRDKWENCFPKYKKINDWDKGVPSGCTKWAQMDVDEREEKGLPKTFDEDIFNIIQERFAEDVLVDPGPIVVDSSSAEIENLNGNGNVRPAPVAPSTAANAGSAQAAADVNCTAKKRARQESRTNLIKKDFHEISKNLIETIDRGRQQTSLDQRANVQDLIAVQERFAETTREQVQGVQRALDQMAGFMEQFLARQP